MSKRNALLIIVLFMFLIVLLPWWFSYYRPPGYPWEWGQLQDERWDYLWLFGVCIQVGRSPGAVVCFVFSNFFWVRPTGDIPSWADLWGRSLFLPYVRLFPGLYFILGLVFLSFILMIKGEQSKSIGYELAGSIGLLLAPTIFYALMSESLLAQTGHFFGGFYICFVASLFGFFRAYRIHDVEDAKGSLTQEEIIERIRKIELDEKKPKQIPKLNEKESERLILHEGNEECGNCTFFLTSKCPRNYASDSDVWRSQKPCDLFEMKKA